jgi:hypothetical protein
MSYGFLAENDNGEIVIDDSLPIYSLVNETTVSGTTSPDHSWYEYDACVGATPLFYKMPNPSILLTGENGKILSGESSLQVREAQNISGRPSLGGYGMEIFDASGNMVFSSSYDMVPIDDQYVAEIDFDNSTSVDITASGDWVHLPSTAFRAKYVASGSTDVALYGAGLRRSSANVYQPRLQFVRIIATGVSGAPTSFSGVVQVPALISL